MGARLDGTREEVVHTGPDAPAAFVRCRALLWSYRFYPPSIVQGDLRAPAKGVIIDQRIRAGPLRFRGPVRIEDVWDRETPSGRVCGYRYDALPGHVERG